VRKSCENPLEKNLSIVISFVVATFHIAIPQADGHFECDCPLKSIIPKDACDKSTKQVSLSNPFEKDTSGKDTVECSQLLSLS
jgi:hypothetical protein